METRITITALAAAALAGTPALADTRLTALACAFEQSTNLYVVAEADGILTLVGSPEASVLEASGIWTFVTAREVLQIGDRSATLVNNGEATVGACTDMSSQLSAFLQWLSQADGPIAMPVIDYSASQVIEAAEGERLALAAQLAAARAEAAAAAAAIEAQVVTVRDLQRQVARYELEAARAISPLDALDDEVRRTLTTGLRDAAVPPDVSGPLIARMQAGEGLNSPTFADLLAEILRAIDTD